MPFTLQGFVRKWKRVTAREKQTYQEHFIDLCRLVAPATQESVTLSGCYQVTFLGMTESTDRVSTWRYQVEEQACSQDLSNWMLELPACATVVDASPAPWEIVQPDPNYQQRQLHPWLPQPLL